MEFLSSILTSQTSFPGEISACVANFLFQASHHCWGVSPWNDVWQVCGTSAEIFPDTNEQLRSSLGDMGRDPFNQTFPEISVQNSMDRFGPTGKVSRKRPFWGGPLFPVGPVGILFQWIAPMVFVLARKLSCIEWEPFHLSFRESCLFHILPPIPTSNSLHRWDWKKPQESLQRTSAKNKQQHSWVSFGPTFQLHWPQYFWCPGAWHGVALCSGTNIQRKQREMRLTFQLGTVQPKGLNINFSFIWIGTLCSSSARYHTTSSPVLFPQKKGVGREKGLFPPHPFFEGKALGTRLAIICARTSIIFMLHMKLHSTVQRFFLTMKKDHKPETFVFFENIWHFLISVL